MKTTCPPGYHRNGFVATDALGHMMYGYTLLVPMNQTITLLALLVEHSLVHWYQQCVTVNHVPKCSICFVKYLYFLKFLKWGKGQNTELQCGTLEIFSYSGGCFNKGWVGMGVFFCA